MDYRSPSRMFLFLLMDDITGLWIIVALYVWRAPAAPAEPERSSKGRWTRHSVPLLPVAPAAGDPGRLAPATRSNLELHAPHRGGRDLGRRHPAVTTRFYSRPAPPAR